MLPGSPFVRRRLENVGDDSNVKGNQPDDISDTLPAADSPISHSRLQSDQLGEEFVVLPPASQSLPVPSISVSVADVQPIIIPEQASIAPDMPAQLPSLPAESNAAEAEDTLLPEPELAPPIAESLPIPDMLVSQTPSQEITSTPAPAAGHLELFSTPDVSIIPFDGESVQRESLPPQARNSPSSVAAPVIRTLEATVVISRPTELDAKSPSADNKLAPGEPITTQQSFPIPVSSSPTPSAPDSRPGSVTRLRSSSTTSQSGRSLPRPPSRAISAARTQSLEASAKSPASERRWRGLDHFVSVCFS
jgi:hypothetical protein